MNATPDTINGEDPLEYLATAYYSRRNQGDDPVDATTMTAEFEAIIESIRAKAAARTQTRIATELASRLPDVLCETAHDGDGGWLSDAQAEGGIEYDDLRLGFCGQGSIDVHQVGEYAAVIASEAQA